MKIILPIVLSVFSVFCFANGGTIFCGLVIDKNTGVPVKDAVIVLKNNSDKKQLFKTSTNADGKFEFANVPAGNYEAEIYFLDYAKKQNNITVSPGKENNLKIEIVQENKEIKEVSAVK